MYSCCPYHRVNGPIVPMKSRSPLRRTIDRDMIDCRTQRHSGACSRTQRDADRHRQRVRQTDRQRDRDRQRGRQRRKGRQTERQTGRRADDFWFLWFNHAGAPIRTMSTPGWGTYAISSVMISIRSDHNVFRVEKIFAAALLIRRSDFPLWVSLHARMHTA